MAVRIILKRSSIPNKRPNADLLEPGELALNTNALTPGLFFEADNNSIVKVGPTAVGLIPPTLLPSLGETYFNQITRELKVGGFDPETAQQAWLSIASPYLGGTNGFVVFVAPEFPTSSDAIENNGQSSPFKTLNRAAIEVAKNSIAMNNESDEGKNNRFTIVMAPGICPAINGPGLPITGDGASDVNAFDVNFEAATPSLPETLVLQQFNSETGGVLLPRGSSIIGMDLRKVEIRPVYVPTYKNPTTGFGVNQPLSAIIKWTGNSVLQNFSFRDKRSDVKIERFSTGPAGEGVFVSSRPHCFGLNDEILFEFAPGANKTPASANSAGILSGLYYVYPVTPNTFYLSFTEISASEANFVESSQLPPSPQGIGYLATCFWQGVSHNRLRALYPASKVELDTFYTKVQLAFPKFFQGRTNQDEVINPGETEIVGPVSLAIQESILSNTTDNASPYAENVSVRSNYGLCGLEQNGDIVSGFRSALAGSFTVVSIQNDPVAYEIYTTVQDPDTGETRTRWYTLQYATWASLPSAVRPPSPILVTNAQQLELLNGTEVVNIRYLFTTLKSNNGESFGLPDENNDFRHFAIKVSNRGFAQIDSSYSVGCAVGFWAIGGGQITSTSSSSNFGLNALRSEGFYRIGSDSSSSNIDPSDSGFVFEGIRMPDRLLPQDTINFKTVEIGGAILSVVINGGIQEITLGFGFQPINILPYSLAPETAVYVSTRGNVVYRAFFVNDGLPTVVVRQDGTSVLRVRSIDSTFPLGAAETNPSILNWSSPFIKRWLDPRTLGEASYALILENTLPYHNTPTPGSIFRLNQNSTAASLLLRPGVQLDPGPSGGWGRVFQAGFVETALAGNSPQFNEVMLNANFSNSYYVYPVLCDSARPWIAEKDSAHGIYTTYENRNWYAACNDEWDEVYYNSSLAPSGEIKIQPSEVSSPWVTSFSSELQEPVEDSYQGAYAPDPLKDAYLSGTYFRGDTLSFDNFAFELVVNIDNGTPNFGLLRHTQSTTNIKTLTEALTPVMTTVTVDNVTDIPNPVKQFVVLQIESGLDSEYVQVIGINVATNTLTIIRGLYGTKTTSTWPVGSAAVYQVATQEVLTEDYDFNWSISKSTMIRFLQVMGYSDVAIKNLLRPRYGSFRNVLIANISDKPVKGAGYAVSTGAWPLEFAQSSRLDAASHTFHSVGRFTYSRGLPPFIRNEIPTKQYFDYMSTQLWGGTVNLEGSDELGNIPTNGEARQSETGRPVGTFTSDIKTATRVDPGPGEGGGGGGGGGVTAVFTGPGLTGGPIFAEGTISLLPPTSGSIGGVKAGANITIDPDGTISSSGGGGGGTVSSIVFNNGLTGGTITQSGTVGVNIGAGLQLAGNGSLAVKPGSTSEIGGVKAGTAINISTEGTISVLPPVGPIIGGVKQGTGVTIATDGTISATGTTVTLLGDLSSQFNGTQTQFTLTSSTIPFSPVASHYALISVGGIIQATPSAYGIIGSTITFTSPPPAGATFYGIAFG